MKVTKKTDLQAGDQIIYIPSRNGKKGFIKFVRNGLEIHAQRNESRPSPYALPGHIHCADEESFMFVAELIAGAVNMGIEFTVKSTEQGHYCCTLIAKT